jgi:ribonuclease J
VTSSPPAGVSSSPSPLQIIPLGGLGEFGLNCTVLRYEQDLIVIDAGVMFPEELLLGVNLVIPEFAWLFERPDRVRGILLTHGHEDHVGALPYLFEKVAVPVYGSDMTLGLAARRLKEHRLRTEGLLRTVKAGDDVTLGPFRVEFLQVTHSIPGTLALAITTPAGTVIHSADFKMDQTPIDGRTFDFQAFSYYGDQGVLALLSDSTNAEVEGFTGSERLVGTALDTVFRRASGRILFSTFASNVHRLQQVIDRAVAWKRKVALCGSSMGSVAAVSQDLGHLRVPPGVIIDPSEVRRVPPSQLVVLAGGSQGEPMSALSRIALDDHRDVSIGEGDVVFVSARAIPGNERAINRVVNHIHRRGAEVIFGSAPPYHVSGHASQEELKILLTLTRPRFFVPIHGEIRQLYAHARLAESTGLDRRRILLAESGDVIEIDGNAGQVVSKVRAGRVLIDGTLEEVDEIVVRDRRHISEGGIVLAVVAIDRQSGLMEGEPEIVSRGFVPDTGLGERLREATSVVRRAVEAATPEERADRGVLKAMIQQELKRFFRKTLDKRPMIIPVVVET